MPLSILGGIEGQTVSERLSDFMKQSGISEILEWTFMYNKESKTDATPYNTTFFESVGGYTYEQWKNGDIDKDALINKVSRIFDSWIHTLEGIQRDLGKNGENKEKVKLEREGIDYMIVSIRTAQSAIPIELEKASPIPILQEEDRQQLVAEVEQGQTQLYGPKISENPDEVILSLELLCEEYFKGGKYLTNGQKIQLVDIYDKLVEKLRDIPKYENAAFPEITNYQEREITKHPITKEALEKAEKIIIPREVYMQLWQQYIDATGLRQRVVLNPNAGSIYDGANELQIPEGDIHKEKNLKEVLMLMMHEIGVHYVNQATSENNGYQVRGARNVDKEEGLAKIMEWLFEGKKLKDLKEAGFSYPYILAGELLTKKDRQALVDLRLRMDEDIKGKTGDTHHQRDLRVMRGYPLDGPGAQRKDSSYGRGANKIIALITRKQCSITDLYRGKFSIEDITSGRLDSLIPREKIVFPLLFPDMIIFLIAKGRKEFTHANFMNYLQEKYMGDIDEDDLNSVETIKEFSKMKIFLTMWKEIEGYMTRDNGVTTNEK